MGKAIFLGKNTNGKLAGSLYIHPLCMVLLGCCYVTAPCELFGKLLLKFKKSNNNSAELPSPVGKKTKFNELEV